MPRFQAMISELNDKFSPQRVAETAENLEPFAPGQKLSGVFARSPLHMLFSVYLEDVPFIFKDTLRAVMHHALSTKPPTPVAFAWAPGYDFELTMWQAPDTPETRGGITVLVKTRYPDDKHPLHPTKAV